MLLFKVLSRKDKELFLTSEKARATTHTRAWLHIVFFNYQLRVSYYVRHLFEVSWIIVLED